MSMKFIKHIDVDATTQAAMEFTSIPQNYTDLYLTISGRSDRVLISDGVDIQFNLNTSNYSGRRLYFYDGTIVTSNPVSNTEFGGINGSTSTSSVFAICSFYITNYSSSVAKNFSVDHASENDAAGNFMGINAGLWNDASPITSITVSPWAGNFVQYSSATLYGITKGSDGTTAVS